MRWNIINMVIEAIGAKTYLGIGLLYGDTIRRITDIERTGVDPNLAPFRETNQAEFKYLNDQNRLYEMTSDDFFATYKGDRFDVIFIDGMHQFAYVQRDLENALKILNDGGAIILHDTMPPDQRYATRIPTLISRSGNSLWCGDAWRIFTWLSVQEDLNYWTVDEDYGLTIVVKESPEPQMPVPDNWTYYFGNRLKVGRVFTLDYIKGRIERRNK